MGSYGTKLFYSTTSGGTYTEFANLVRSITPPQMTRGSASGDHLNAPGRAHIKRPSWVQPGTMSFVLLMEKTSYALIHGTIFPSLDNYFWRIDLPALTGETTGGKIPFEGFLSQFQLSELTTDDDDTVLVNCTIEVSGFPGWTAPVMA
jgi:hypothetical protein